MLVMDVIAEILKREGVSTLFCFPTTPIIEAAAAVGIKPVICRQERDGVHMADGFARRSNGRPAGVVAMRGGGRTAFSGFGRGGFAAARAPARPAVSVSSVQLEPFLCCDHQIGRRSDA